jgi:colicin import membrane protein
MRGDNPPHFCSPFDQFRYPLTEKNLSKAGKKPGMKPITIMLIVSVCIHAAVFTLLTLMPWLSPRKIHVPVYHVTLVTQAAQKPEAPQPRTEVTKKPVQKPPEKPKEKPITVKKTEPKKEVLPKKKPVRKDVISEKRIQRKIESAIEELRKKAEAEEKPEAKEEKKPEVKEEVAQVAPKPSRAVIDLKLRTYYNTIWQRIKEEWILSPSLLEESEDLETVIVIKVQRDGGIVESWFEKKSGSLAYDESAMRAIKKANPLPPFPQELGEDFLEIGIRFHPE